MSYTDLFRRYGCPATEAEIDIRAYLTRPDNLKETKWITYNDGKAAEMIARCQKMIEALTEYRQALASRYAELETMPYSDRVELERQPARFTGDHVKYYLRIVRRYSDGTETEQSSETFSGPERREALKRFEEIRKQRPGIEAKQDIERRSWER